MGVTQALINIKLPYQYSFQAPSCSNDDVYWLISVILDDSVFTTKKRHRSLNMLTIFLIFCNIIASSDWNVIYGTHFRKKQKQTYYQVDSP